MPRKDVKSRAEFQRDYHLKHKKDLNAYNAAYNRTPMGRLRLHKGYSKTHGIEFTLTLEEYLPLDKLPCHYCGGPRPETGIGLDRIDNARGYSADNVVPCCSMCNLARNNNMTSEEFMTFIAPAIRALRAHRLALQNAK